MSAMKKLTRVLVSLAGAALLAGCSTFASFNERCPAVYSGVKYNRAFEESDNVNWRRDPDQELFLLVDLPLSALLDTVCLPYTLFAGPCKHTVDSEGCAGVAAEE